MIKIKQKERALPSKEESRGLASEAFERKPEKKGNRVKDALKWLAFCVVSVGVILVAYEITKPLD